MSLTYKKAGVDISLAGKVLKSLKKPIASTFSKNVLSDIGKFGGFYSISKDDVLVASIDGVGTKIKIANMAKEYKCIGEDIVNHSVNDISVHNATPMFFLDYIAMEKLKKSIMKQIVDGMIKACKENNVALIGGETAEMPGIYYKGMFDVAGTIIGSVNKKNIIDGSKIRDGNILIGVASNGLHTNGFSFVNHLFFEINRFSVNKYFKEIKTTLKNALLKPHLSYLKLIKRVSQELEIKGMAHITGGGIRDNLSRVIPDGLKAVVEKNKIDILPIFKLIQKLGNVDETEMFKIFNMGVGLIIVIDKKEIEHIFKVTKKLGYKLSVIGKIVPAKSKFSQKVEII